MTDEQIIKALRLCAIDVDVCTEACPYYEDREYFIWTDSHVTEYQYIAELVYNLVKEMTEE